MSKKRRSKRVTVRPVKTGKGRIIAVIALMAVLLVTGLLVAQRASLWGARPTAAPQTSPPLAKEYIYAGGKLVATEEPGGTSLSSPTNLLATAVSATQINVTWIAPTGYTGLYEIQRKQRTSDPYITVTSSASTTSFTDSSVSSGITYLYRVRAIGSGGSGPSDYSNIDLATTIVFTDSPLVSATTVIKAIHMIELRQAVNAVKNTAELAGAIWTDASPQGVNVKVVHIQELRTNLDQALSALGFPTPPYTNPTLTPGTTISKVHWEELRQRVK